MLKDKVPPHNDDAEKATLGALLLDSSAFDTVVGIVRPRDFYKNSHKLIYETLLDLKNQGENPDLISLARALQSAGRMEASGGPAYISELTSSVPTSANVEYYAKVVKDDSIRRNVISMAQEITAKAYEDGMESRGLIEVAEKKIFELVEDRQSKAYQSAGELIPGVVEKLHELHKNKNAFSGIPTGYPELDSLTTGFHKAELIILGARPSIGKTTFALNLATYMSLHKKIPVGFFTCEMSNPMILLRMLASESRLDFKNLRSGLLKPGDFVNISQAVSRIYEAPFFTDDTPNIPLLDLRAQARRMRKKEGVEIIFIDYISLITPEARDLPRHEQVAEISRSLKALARELDIPIVALSQVSRDVEGKRPTLSHLRESGSLEQDADLVMFLHRERSNDKEDDGSSSVIETQLIIEKNRNGPLGTIKLGFLAQYTRFESMEDNHL